MSSTDRLKRAGAVYLSVWFGLFVCWMVVMWGSPGHGSMLDDLLFDLLASGLVAIVPALVTTGTLELMDRRA